MTGATTAVPKTSPDTTGPVLLFSSPTSGKWNVLETTRMYFQLDDLVTTSTVLATNSILLSELPAIGSLIDRTPTVTDLSRAEWPNSLQVTSTPLSVRTTYAVWITNNVTDSNQWASNQFEFEFQTTTDIERMGKSVPAYMRTSPERYGPFISESNPSNARSNIQTSSRIVMSLSTAVNVTTLSTGVVVRRVAPILETLSIDSILALGTGYPSDSYMILTSPSTPLLPNSTYAIYLSNIVEDLAGRPSPTDEFYFETVIRLEDIHSQVPSEAATRPTSFGPVILAANPSQGRYNVSTQSRIFLTMSEDVSGMTLPGAVKIHRLTTNNSFEIPLSGPPTLIASPANTWEIPFDSAALTLFETFGVFVTNIVNDTEGHPSLGDGIRFQTHIDATSMFQSVIATHRTRFPAPVLTKPDPSHARMNVSTRTGIYFTYNQASLGVSTTSVAAYVLATNVGNLIPISGTTQSVSPTNTFEFIPSAPLTIGTTYGIFLSNGIQTPEGLHSPGDEFWFSTTIDESSIGTSIPASQAFDVQRFGPVLATSNPENGKFNVQTTSRVLMTFTTAVNMGTITPQSVNMVTVTTPNVYIEPMSFSLLTTGPPNTVEMHLSAPLTVDTSYAVLITNRVEALNGARSSGDDFYFSTFYSEESVGALYPTSVATDIGLGPLVLRSNPANGQYNVTTDTGILITFNQPIVHSSVVLPGAIQLSRINPTPVSNLAMTVTTATTPENSFEITPSVPLTSNTSYGVFVTNRVISTIGVPSPGDDFFFSTVLDPGYGGLENSPDVLNNPDQYGPIVIRFMSIRFMYAL